MIVRPRAVFAVVWIAWLVSWIGAAVWASRPQARLLSGETLIYRLAILAGAVLLFPGTARRLQLRQIWHVGLGGAYVLAGITAVGLLFTWWARIHLGRLWSGSITRKQDHRVVDTGPYAWVRHPIYTGLILALFATAIAQATVSALAGAALISFGFWLKARMEERFLSAELGPDAYAAYRRRVPMLIPLARGRP